MTSQVAAGIKPEAVARGIRKLRDDLTLTQVQLASAVGITPTSIYRYEAGASTPDAETLAAFWYFALHNGSTAAVDFSEMLADLIEPLRPLLESASVDQERLVESTGIRLQPEDRILAMAFIKMLQNPRVDAMTMRLVRVLLEPWIEQAKAEFAQQLDNSLSRKSQSTGSKNKVEATKTEEVAKTPRSKTHPIPPTKKGHSAKGKLP